MEARLLDSGPELENSIVRIVVTRLELPSEAGIRQATAHRPSFRRFRLRRAIDVAGKLHLVRSGVPASTVRQQGGTPWWAATPKVA